jgi:hypothetical protein
MSARVCIQCEGSLDGRRRHALIDLFRVVSAKRICATGGTQDVGVRCAKVGVCRLFPRLERGHRGALGCVDDFCRDPCHVVFPALAGAGRGL